MQRRGVASTAVAGKKERIVILGTGWAAFRMVRSLSSNDFDVVVVSPRNHFLFTPLLPSTASGMRHTSCCRLMNAAILTFDAARAMVNTGTLSFRSIIEPIRSSHYMKKVTYYQAKARAIKQDESAIVCEGVLDDRVFELKYDKVYTARSFNLATSSLNPGRARSHVVGDCDWSLEQHVQHSRRDRERHLHEGARARSSRSNSHRRVVRAREHSLDHHRGAQEAVALCGGRWRSYGRRVCS